MVSVGLSGGIGYIRHFPFKADRAGTLRQRLKDPGLMVCRLRADRS